MSLCPATRLLGVTKGQDVTGEKHRGQRWPCSRGYVTVTSQATPRPGARGTVTRPFYGDRCRERPPRRHNQTPEGPER